MWSYFVDAFYMSCTVASVLIVLCFLYALFCLAWVVVLNLWDDLDALRTDKQTKARRRRHEKILNEGKADAASFMVWLEDRYPTSFSQFWKRFTEEKRGS